MMTEFKWPPMRPLAWALTATTAGLVLASALVLNGHNEPEPAQETEKPAVWRGAPMQHCPHGEILARIESALGEIQASLDRLEGGTGHRAPAKGRWSEDR